MYALTFFTATNATNYSATNCPLLPIQSFVMERVMGIEPTCPAWKAGALPLSYTRPTFGLNCQFRRQDTANFADKIKLHHQFYPIQASIPDHHYGGGGRIRTYVDVRRQIYSLLPLTTRPPLRLTISESEAKLRNIGICSPMSTLIGQQKRHPWRIAISSRKPFQVVDLFGQK